ncbi:MAG: hypothetical protein ACREMA_09150 [Longimicrobiales bacterium]
MRGDLVERRYSDEELRRILAEATRLEQQSDRIASSQQGLTLGEIREIAHEVGIDPADVDRAAANLVASESSEPAAAPRIGFTRVLHEEMVIARPLTDREIQLIGSQLQRVLGHRGTLNYSPEWVEWRDHKQRLYIAIVRGRDKTRGRVIADQSGELIGGSVVIGSVGLLGVPALFEAGWATPLLVAAGATVGFFTVYSRWRTRSTRKYMRGLLEILREAVPA